MGNLITLIIASILTIFAVQSCNVKDRQISQLNLKIEEINDTHEAELHKICMDSVDRACNYADCAVMSIEQIQDEVCKYLEKQE